MSAPRAEPARVLVLHAALGTGHRAAAHALGAAFRSVGGATVQVEDTLRFANRFVRDRVVQVYLDLSTQAPLLWKFVYEGADVEDLRATLAGNRLRGLLEGPLVADLNEYVTAFAPDAIVCTHLLPVDLLHARAAAGRLPARIHCVLTDFMIHSAWISDVVDRYFVASDLTRDAMLGRGVAADRVRVTGIPVDLSIARATTSAEARARRGLPAGGPIVAVFGGGLRPARARALCLGLTRGGLDGLLVFTGGRSPEVAAAVADVPDGERMAIRRFGLVDFVDDLVAAADLVVTKSGGLIVSEVLARGRPLVIVDPIPGQEEWNADAVVAAGAGVQVRHVEMVPEVVRALLAQPDRLAALTANARRAGRPRAALDVAAAVMDDLRATNTRRPPPGAGAPW